MSRPLVVLFDANVFFGAALRSFVVQAAASRIYVARWSVDIHEEWISAVQRSRSTIEREALERIRRLMDRAVPDALVENYHHLIPTLELPDARDRHVLAAAIVCRADHLVTFNERDFPREALIPHAPLQVRHPDEFFLKLLESDEVGFLEAVRTDLAHYRRPSLTAEIYVAALRRAGVPKTAGRILEALAA